MSLTVSKKPSSTAVAWQVEQKLRSTSESQSRGWTYFKQRRGSFYHGCHRAVRLGSSLAVAGPKKRCDGGRRKTKDSVVSFAPPRRDHGYTTGRRRRHWLQIQHDVSEQPRRPRPTTSSNGRGSRNRCAARGRPGTACGRQWEARMMSLRDAWVSLRRTHGRCSVLKPVLIPRWTSARTLALSGDLRYSTLLQSI